MAAPIAQPLTISGSEDTDILVTLDASDADLDPLTYEIVDAPLTGELTADLRGGPADFIYRPEADFNGPVTFTWRAFDGVEYSDTVTVELTVDPVADAPVLNLGYAVTPVQTLVSPGDGIDSLGMAPGTDVVAVLWHGTGGGDDDGILINVYDTENFYTPNATALVNTTTTDAQFDPSLSSLLSGFVVTWTSANQDGSGNGVYMQRLDQFGNALGGEQLVNSDHTSGDQGESAVVAGGPGYIVTWSSTDAGETHIFRQQYDTGGGTVGGTVQVDTIPGFDGYAPSIAELGGNYVITWATPDGDGYDVLGQIYDSNGAEVGGNFMIAAGSAGDQTQVKVLQVPATGFVAAFASAPYGGPADAITLRLFDNNGSALSGDIGVATTGTVVDFSLTKLPGGFALAWEEISNNEHAVFLQRFNSMGLATDSAVRINPTGPLGESAPALLFDGAYNVLNVAYVSEQAAAPSQVSIEQFNVPGMGGNLLEGISTGFPFQNATITDIDSAELTSISISIINGQQGDLFAYDVSAYPSVSVNYDDAILTFMGPLPVADFQEILRSVGLYVSNGGAASSRTLQVQAQSIDGNSLVREFSYGVVANNQTLVGDGNANLLVGGNGIDTLTGNAGIDQLYGNAANDALNGGSFNDQLFGGDGDDTLNGGFDNDYMEGGIGDDVYLVNSSLDVVSEFSEEGFDVVHASASFTLTENVEDLYLTGAGNLMGYGSSSNNLITGNAGNNTLGGNDGDDTLDGGSGNDELIGGTGMDLMRGGYGDDTYHFETGDSIVEYFNQGTDTVLTFNSLAISLYIENGTLDGSSAANLWGNVQDNTLTGNSNANSLNGGDGNDTLAGMAGNDTLVGGTGVDFMVGNTGNDTYYVDHDSDDVQEEMSEGTDTVITNLSSFTLYGNVENLTIQGGEGSTFSYGNELNNVLKGNSQDNQFHGGNGKDTIQGNAGADYLFGDAGNDIITGGAGFDTLHGGAGFDQLSGGDDNDFLNGQNGNDTLNGGNGDDDLEGGAGHDLLTGGAGLDYFSYFSALNAGTNVDTITDFNAAEDVIFLDGDYIFTTISSGILSASAFIVGTAATSETHRIVYDDGTGALYYDADGLGGVAAVQFATLGNLTAITEANIEVYSFMQA